tara:strand:- start:1721 stop:2008 length:288 start_codon:yes stop_codon:yes gene_type:complete
MNEPVNGNFGQQQEGQEQEVVITLGDLSTVLQIIDVVSQRGGFQGQELAGVGTLRNKLETFLRQKGPKQPDTQALGGQDAGVDTSVEGLAGKLID